MKLFRRLLLVVVLLLLFFYEENNYLTTTYYHIISEKITKPIRIAHLSDLHSRTNDNFLYSINKFLKQNRPDLILISGDLVDRDASSHHELVKYISNFKEFAPTYWVSGNHEEKYQNIKSFKEELNQEGIVNLDNIKIKIKIKNQTLLIGGIKDPLGPESKEKAITSANLNEINANEKSGAFEILLAHRAEYLELYNATAFDLILSGHAHGGVVRLPFIGGLYAPRQGFLPQYTAGLYGKTIVSRGLGNTKNSFRIFHHPEAIIIDLENN